MQLDNLYTVTLDQRMITTRQKVRGMLDASPAMKFSEIAAKLGVSRERVRSIARELGYPRRREYVAAKTGTPEYKAWHGMIARCTNPKHQAWRLYGERGIRVCDRWINSYDAFVSDMGDRPSPKHSIDRIDNDGHYEPRNCRWATQVEQINNRRRFEKTASLRERAHKLRALGYSYRRIQAEIGWKSIRSVSVAMETYVPDKHTVSRLQDEGRQARKLKRS